MKCVDCCGEHHIKKLLKKKIKAKKTPKNPLLQLDYQLLQLDYQLLQLDYQLLQLDDYPLLQLDYPLLQKICSDRICHSV